jgi:hypothetical protein
MLPAAQYRMALQTLVVTPARLAALRKRGVLHYTDIDRLIDIQTSNLANNHPLTHYLNLLWPP